MKRFDLRSTFIGIIIGSIGVTTVFATGGIKSATFNSSKVYFYGQEIPLKNSLVSIIEDGETSAKLYMPVRELLEYMEYNVEWNSADSSINLTEGDFDEERITKNFNHNNAKKHTMKLIEQHMSKTLTNPSYQTNVYELNGQQYAGQIYVLNNNDDIEYIMKILKMGKPIFLEINYEPTNTYVFLGDVNMGFANNRDYYWSDGNGKTYGFTLSEIYSSELWELLNSFEYRAIAD